MKKAILLILIALIPVYFVPFDYSGAAETPPANIGLIRALTLSAWLSILLGGLVSIILRHKRAIWWSMVVVFVYSYLNLGLIWGGFWSSGIFSREIFSAASTFAVAGFLGATFTYGMITIIRKVVSIEQQQQKRPPQRDAKRKR